jgi:hypothetical protein
MVSVLTVPSRSRLVPILINVVADFDSIAAQELVASLLQGERFVSSHFLESRRSNSFVVMFKEQLVGFLNALTDILYCLRADQLPEGFTLSQFGNMSLKFVAIQVLAPHAVVPFVECNAMVINYPSRIDSPLEVLITLALIQLELQGFHATIIDRIDLFMP